MIIRFGDIVEENGKTIRENNLSKKHNIPIGSLVEVRYDKWHGNGACEKVHARLFVIQHGRDCDGTPLYSLASKPKEEWWGEVSELIQSLLYNQVNGFIEEDLTPIDITPDIARGDGALQWEDKNDKTHP